MYIYLNIDMFTARDSLHPPHWSSFELSRYGGANSSSGGSGQQDLGSREEFREGVAERGSARGGEGA